MCRAPGVPTVPRRRARRDAGELLGVSASVRSTAAPPTGARPARISPGVCERPPRGEADNGDEGPVPRLRREGERLLQQRAPRARGSV